MNGYNTFDPSELKDNSHKPILLVTGIKKMGKSVFFDKPVDEIKELNLSYKENVFTIEFAALDYTMPKKNQYAYMLSGLDKDWIMAGNNRSVTYSNLPAGDYIFKVKGSNNDGVWNEEGASLAINIHPPFWKTWWFYSLAVFVIFGGSLLFVILRIRNLKQAKRKLQSEVASRTRRAK